MLLPGESVQDMLNRWIECLHHADSIDDLLCPVCDSFVSPAGCPDHPTQNVETPQQPSLFT